MTDKTLLEKLKESEAKLREIIDTVSVVRCKDCLYCYAIKKKDGSTYFHKCDFFDIEIEEFDFCSRGERGESGK